MGALSAVAFLIVSVGVIVAVRRSDEPPRQLAKGDDGLPAAKSGDATHAAAEPDTPAPAAGTDDVASPSDEPEEDGRGNLGKPRRAMGGTIPLLVDDAGDAKSSEEASDPGRPFSDFCFDELPSDDSARYAAWAQWLRPLEDGRLIDIGGATPGKALIGPVKLDAILDEGRAVRLLLSEHDQLKLHCWSGTNGITLEYSELPLPAWAAYSATRRRDELRPHSMALVDVDNGRYRRTGYRGSKYHDIGQGTIELRYQDGLIVLSRGDVPLLVAPLADTPELIVFDGRATLRSLDVVASGPFPLHGARQRNRIAGFPPPGRTRVAATSDRRNGRISLAEGRMELLVEDGSEIAWAGTPVDDAGPARGRIRDRGTRAGHGRLSWRRKGSTTLPGWLFPNCRAPMALTTARANRLRLFARQATCRPRWHDGRPGPRPRAGQRQWLRLVFGGGSLKCWTSGDGVHWGLAWSRYGN